MICSDFWTNFWANGLSTLIAGTLIGFLFTLIASRISRIKEKKLKELDNQLIISKKALSFLTFLQVEIEDIVVFFEVNKNKIKSIELMRYIRFNTSYWEILKTSGEIPSLLEPTALRVFTNFYAAVNKCNLLYEQFLDAENNGRANIENILIEEFTKEIQSVLTMINITQIDLIVEQVINNKKREIDALEKIKNFPKNK